MSKINGIILCAELVKMTNKETGEVSEMTKINYTIDVNSTDERVGCGIMECYIRGNKVKALEPYTKVSNMNGKNVRVMLDIELEERLTKNSKKLYVSKIGDLSLR